MSDAVNGLLFILCEIEGLVCYVDNNSYQESSEWSGCSDTLHV